MARYVPRLSRSSAGHLPRVDRSSGLIKDEEGRQANSCAREGGIAGHAISAATAYASTGSTAQPSPFKIVPARSVVLSRPGQGGRAQRARRARQAFQPPDSILHFFAAAADSAARASYARRAGVMRESRSVIEREKAELRMLFIENKKSEYKQWWLCENEWRAMR